MVRAGGGGDFTTKVLPWETKYARRLAVTDLIVIAWAVIGAQLARFGLDQSEVVFRRSADREFQLSLDYTTLSFALVIVWMATLSLFGTRDPRIVGSGTTEYRRIVFRWSFPTKASHPLELRPLGDGRVDVDAFIVLR